MKGHKFHVYIKPFDDKGNYTSYQEVTADVELDKIGEIAQDLDNADYDIGIYRNNNLSISFRNDSGKYSDVGSPNSIFRYTRSLSLLRVTWESETEGLKCGFFKAGQPNLTQETELFVGLIDDSSLEMDLDSQELNFTVMGRESILNNATVPTAGVTQVGQTATISIASPGVFTTPGAHGLVVGNPVSFSTTGALPTGLTAGTPYYVSVVGSSTTFQVSSSLNGSSVNTSGSQSGTHTVSLLFGLNLSTVIYACLNQPVVSNLLTVSPGNITVGTNCALDSVVDLLNKTVWDALSDLLLLSNSVLYVSNGAIIVAPRTPTASVQFNFYGQSSISGIENIQTVKAIKNGVSRIFNYLTWNPSNVVSQDATSISKYGSKTKEFTQTYITNSINQATILANILAEFKLPKQEFDLYTPLWYDTIALNLLGRVSIDHPPIYLPGINQLPICGQAICGQAILPDAIWSFVVSPNDYYKVIGKSVDPKSCLVKFHMRKV